MIFALIVTTLIAKADCTYHQPFTALQQFVNQNYKSKWIYTMRETRSEFDFDTFAITLYFFSTRPKSTLLVDAAKVAYKRKILF